MEGTIAELREELSGLQERLEEKTKVVEQVKKVSARSAKVLDAALKEISSCVSRPGCAFGFRLRGMIDTFLER